MRANEVALNGVRQEALVGSRTTLDVLNAEQELLNAQVSLVQARHDVQVSYYGVLAGIGRLTARTLALPVEYYDEETILQRGRLALDRLGHRRRAAGPAARAGSDDDDQRRLWEQAMSDPKSASNDPSMDDILASIRKIISDDEARAQVNSQQGSRPEAAPSPAAGPPAGSPTGPQPQSEGRDDVLLLTDLIEGPKADATPAGTDPLAQRSGRRARRRRRRPLPSRPWWAPTPPTARQRHFARLSQTAQDNMPPPVAADPGPVVGGSGKTVEDIVKEMLRPMLKEWLDRNLPQMVERFVEREIVRLTRR